MFFWDGRTVGLEEQVLKPIEDSKEEDPKEMDLPLTEAAARVGFAPEVISRSLASFVRSILSGIRAWTVSSTVTARRSRPKSKQGRTAALRGKANCVACNVGPNFTDERLHNTAITWPDPKLPTPVTARAISKCPPGGGSHSALHE
jgi:cytochrome c peroxidase